MEVTEGLATEFWRAGVTVVVATLPFAAIFLKSWLQRLAAEQDEIKRKLREARVGHEENAQAIAHLQENCVDTNRDGAG
jgi:heme exporter protein D